MEEAGTSLVCGSCGGSAFESVMGKRVCLHCHAEVDNEVAVAIEQGLEGLQPRWCKSCNKVMPVEVMFGHDQWTCLACGTVTTGIEEYRHADS